VLFVFFVFVLCLVYPMLRVSLDCPFLIAPSGFSSIYSLIIITIIFHLEGMYGPNKTALNPPLFIKVPGPRYKSEWSCTCLLEAGAVMYMSIRGRASEVSILPLTTIFLLDVGSVLTVWYILIIMFFHEYRNPVKSIWCASLPKT